MTFVAFLTRPEPGRPVVYTAEWVNRLWAGLRRHRTGPMRLVCFTDGDGNGIRPEVEIRPVPDPSLRTWWHRLPLFREDVARSIADGAPFTNIDLDTVVTGSIDWIGQLPGPFSAARDWGHPLRLNAGLWTLTPGGYGAAIWDRFARDRESIIARWHGDSEWIGSLPLDPAPAYYQDHFPGAIWSYKWGHMGERKGHKPLEACPEGASLISFHGLPKQTNLPPGHWARHEWERE